MTSDKQPGSIIAEVQELLIKAIERRKRIALSILNIYCRLIPEKIY
jgi:hypothetical protein